MFDTKTNLVTMIGGVVLTQGKNVLRGDRLLVDMTTGVSRVESDSGRVQGLFQSSGGQRGGPCFREQRPARRRRRAVPAGRNSSGWGHSSAAAPQINLNNINHLFDIRRRRG